MQKSAFHDAAQFSLDISHFKAVIHYASISIQATLSKQTDNENYFSLFFISPPQNRFLSVYAFLWEKVKTVDFSETIAACDLKVGRCRQLIEIMKLSEY